MYWLIMLDPINRVAGTVAIILSVPAAILAIIMLVSSFGPDATSARRTPARPFYGILITEAILCLVNMFLPNTKQAAAIWLVPWIVNNEAIQGIADETGKTALGALELANEYISDKLRELKASSEAEEQAKGE